MILSRALVLRTEVMLSPGNATDLAAEQLPYDGAETMLQTFAISTVAWLALFYILCASFPYWSSKVDPSAKEHENDRYWFTRDVIGIIHALVICIFSLPPLYFLVVGGSTRTQFASTNHLAVCEVNHELDPDLVSWQKSMEAIAFAGLLFTSFTLADLFVLFVHKLATVDYVVHHLAFLTAGLIIRCNCMLPLNAAILMGMEVSTPFLNWVMIFRHRGERYKLQVIVAGTFFFFTFIFFRVGLNLYGASLLFMGQAEGLALPSRVPTWQATVILSAIAAGSGLQLFWLPKIWRMFGLRIWQLLVTGQVETADDEEEDSYLTSGTETSREK